MSVARPRWAWAALAAALAFVLLTWVDLANRLVTLDRAGIGRVRTLDGSWVVPVMRAATFVASGAGAIPIALLIAIWLAAHDRRPAATFYTVTCLGGWACNLLLKELIRHHRPIGISPKLTAAGWYSYPSGHEMLAVIVFGLGADLLTRSLAPRARAAVLGLAGVSMILVALSRVYLGAHWPSDVLGAALAGVAWSAGALALYDPESSAAPYTVA
jgi:undecaprenyl-diphosphatase